MSITCKLPVVTSELVEQIHKTLQTLRMWSDELCTSSNEVHIALRSFQTFRTVAKANAFVHMQQAATQVAKHCRQQSEWPVIVVQTLHSAQFDARRLHFLNNFGNIIEQNEFK